ncbi:helix-turn-helix domain-containing protein, partial [Achromobacter ruhlandii]|uniref:helix-turn-helix domain-containing protein n=1 Tax=Achromobacter ruhlandii TaxID=72557 RepID=UPI003D23C14B
MRRAFSRATGMTPHAYQMQRRLLLARRLLRQGMALADAAAAAGFADHSHMTRPFSRATGVPPGRSAPAATPCRRAPQRPRTCRQTRGARPRRRRGPFQNTPGTPQPTASGAPPG